MKTAKIIISVILFACIFAVPAGAADEQNPQNAAWYRLKADFPAVQAHYEGPQLSRIFGQPFSAGSSPEASAANFITDFSGIFDLTSGELKRGAYENSGRLTQPVMYDPSTSDYKFTLVYYSQFQNDIPVFRAELRLLSRNAPDYPLVLASSSLRDLGDFQAPAAMAINRSLAQNAIRTFSPDLVNFSEGRLVIWAGIDDQEAQPRLAIAMEADNGQYATPDYLKWLFLIDAQTGEILYYEDRIVNVDVSGNVSGMATQGYAADICDEEVPTPLPYARVAIGGNAAFADINGDFAISNPDSNEVIVTSAIRGQWFRVYNQHGANAQLADTLFPPGPANFMHNEHNATEYERAEVNGYISANVVRDFVLGHNPDYPGLQQNEFPVNVNISDVCNAYYDYSSINFFTSGGGCANSAFSTVIYHEYGHHLVAMAGSGQGQYGEGMGDVMGVLISDNPGLAYGFFNNCNEYMRTADNNLQYPCSDEIHFCGQLISGCVWSTRNELAVNYPNEARDIIANLAINAMLLHTGDLITPSITIDYLTLDDDNGDISDGTPHYPEICAGFGAHNMDCPELVLIQFNYSDAFPEYIDPDGGLQMGVEVEGVTQNPVPGTGMFHYNLGSGWIEEPMDVVAPNDYQFDFPGSECGTEVMFYFSAETDQGTTVNDPSSAPASTYSTISAEGFITVFSDNFEDDQGWTVNNSPGLTAGQWERGYPAGGGDRGDPPQDADGSGMCYLTENVYGNSDVDDGSTYLISPAVDLTETDAIISYQLWYTNGFGDDPYNDIFNVYVSNNDGTDWTLAQTFGPVSEPGWTQQSFKVSSHVTPSAAVRVRFEASDLGAGSVVEAGIDAFEVLKIDCEGTAIEDQVANLSLPKEFALIGSFPNPFNASSTIKYDLPRQAHVQLEIFNLLGQSVATLIDGSQPAGHHSIIWNASAMPSGVYFYRLRADDFQDTRKMLLLK